MNYKRWSIIILGFTIATLSNPTMGIIPLGALPVALILGGIGFVDALYGRNLSKEQKIGIVKVIKQIFTDFNQELKKSEYFNDNGKIVKIYELFSFLIYYTNSQKIQKQYLDKLNISLHNIVVDYFLIGRISYQQLRKIEQQYLDFFHSLKADSLSEKIDLLFDYFVKDVASTEMLNKNDYSDSKRIFREAVMMVYTNYPKKLATICPFVLK